MHLPLNQDLHQALLQVHAQLARTPMNVKVEFAESHLTKERQLEFLRLIVEVQRNE
jgi:hypothetical protein